MVGNAAGVVALPRARQSFATKDLLREEVETIASGRMSSEHDHLNALMDAK
ncbi:hypothetical protein [Mesorhizobium sp. STM 4661]|uniref:hypothetical protein n=1 Tax=Mesorhizobium sp. STM 4661 TaxID=1297570 RepID=UPI0002BEBDAD|nr:hypothetical protein [Mesorhizobium sp. STM 4661]CCV10575.1 hypothetical protein MESS4_210070 [Mesorhizobium sp. STM 4661]